MHLSVKVCECACVRLCVRVFFLIALISECYVMSCYAELCHDMLCSVMLRCVSSSGVCVSH